MNALLIECCKVGLDHDTLQCLTMRVYDLCACTRANIRVSLNGRTLPFRSLDQVCRHMMAYADVC